MSVRGHSRTVARMRELCRAALLACVFAASLPVITLAETLADVPERPHVQWKAGVDRQAELLEQALAGVKPADGDTRQLYFIGFAGFGSQAVFKREVIAVRELFDGKFSTQGRSVALINHDSTLEQVPLATPANLDAALQRLGKLMNVERDTLFLFMTSHGDNGVFAIEMPGMNLTSLTPPALKDMLDRSGIKNRVVVISACHSGSFIPTLADAKTLVIAAARADRTSFGCEDKRDWTYFGEAYFNIALRQETSFRRAFDRAKHLISLWEQKDRLTPSLPQIDGGQGLDLGDPPPSTSALPSDTLAR